MIKKQIIMDNALELFAKQGFEATSVQQITEKSGISKGAFYLSFKSKSELIISLIDHFMMQIVSDIDHVVKNESEEKLLYEFYYVIYTFFNKNANLAHLFVTEQTKTVNEPLIMKMRSYEKLIEKSIVQMINRLYKDMKDSITYDLMFCIKNFMGLYSEVILFSNNNKEIDFDLLIRSLVEKTNILAKEITIPFISEEDVIILEEKNTEEVTTPELIQLIDQSLKEIDDGVEKDSLQLLKQEIVEPNLHPAIIKGLIENIQKHKHWKWIAYLLSQYFEE
ncbi:TetR/AcrR family transcriptional regulator [Ornithinibacillus sp. 4-3]|uniref:TetR/AcrR family transcriptional regulator n=1 Tax=Ornithinibacillus sp. 4-3 TaxID=3231488 RepID=A0AB39HQW0_9BACI